MASVDTQASVDTHIEEMEKDGYTIIPNALSQDDVAETLRASKELLSAEEAIGLKAGSQTANKKSVHAAVGKHPLFYEFFLNPPAMQVVRRMIGDDAVLYDANIRVPMPTGAGDRRSGFQVHVDREDATVVPFTGAKHYPIAMNVTWPLVDFTIENGATLVWPGTHLSCEVPEPDVRPPGHVYVEVPAGTAVIWDAALWHAGGVNNGDSPRYSLLAYYQRAWIKGKADSRRLIPPEAVAAMSEQAKSLLGMSSEVSDYSEVKAMSPEQIAALTLEEKKVLGFAIY